MKRREYLKYSQLFNSFFVYGFMEKKRSDVNRLVQIKRDIVIITWLHLSNSSHVLSVSVFIQWGVSWRFYISLNNFYT